ncbi:IS630 family transposase [Rhizobium ruizarguesonis]|uniref:IS630 family transposase n=1 Tax=Rhizobium ruizarguesonis TaxID=2081791 RepID=UPI0013EE9794|nr:IS630 family transposase [Rhizobium ruizarguesonis]
MTQPYSEDHRERAMARLTAGETIRSIAAALSISPSCVSKWKRRLAETGALTPGRIGGHKKRTLSDERAEWLRQRCCSGPFTTRGLVAELAERGIKTDRRAVWVFVRAEGLSFKKTVLPAEQTRPDIARKRQRWKNHQHRIEAHRLVFLDETWIKTNMAPLRGWAPRGQRLAASVPHGHWKTLTFIAALRSDRIDAPWVIDGPINGELFNVYVRKILVPTLAKGDVVILDNLGSHKGQAIRRAIRAAGAHLIFLPPYSPDLNPIEQVFAKLKHLIRKAEPRSVETTWRTAGHMLDAFAPDECANYLRNSGYAAV